MRHKLTEILVMGAGILIYGYWSKFEEMWVEKLDLPPFWKRRS